MSTRKLRDVEASLKKKGFQQREGDHSFFTYHRSSDNKKTSVFTKTSHGATDIGDSIIGKMAQQCQLIRNDFLDLVDCPLNRPGYEAKLKTKGIDV